MIGLYNKFRFVFLVFIFAGTSLFGKTKIPSEKPKLIVGIVVEQMRYDYINRFWNKFEEGGFKLLVKQGTYCKNAKYDYLFTQTSTGYATISTGSYPSFHGVISDRWYARLKEKLVYCVDDDKVEGVGGNSTFGNKSPNNLLITTVGDEIKLSTNFKSKLLGISLRDCGAILSSGHTADAAYWFNDLTGNWMSSTYYMDSLPAWVNGFNGKGIPAVYLDRQWETLLPIDSYTESIGDDNLFEKGLKGKNTFPYDLRLISKAKRGKVDYGLLKSIPGGNSLVKDFAITAIVNEELGQDEYTDFLAISFSSTGGISERFGPVSVEIEDAYLRLDKDIAHLLTYLDETIGSENVLVYLTADHGVSHVPEYQSAHKIPSGVFNQYSAVALLKSYFNILYGDGDWIKLYDNMQLYLNHSLIEDAEISLDEIQNKAAQFLLQFTGVANTITSENLLRTNYTKGIFRKAQNSFNQKYSGDIILFLQPGWQEISEYATTYSSGCNDDTHVPLIWYGWKVKRNVITSPVDIVDIAPTITEFLNISLPNGSSGNPIPALTE